MELLEPIGRILFGAATAQDEEGAFHDRTYPEAEPKFRELFGIRVVGIVRPLVLADG